MLKAAFKQLQMTESRMALALGDGDVSMTQLPKHSKEPAEHH